MDNKTRKLCVLPDTNVMHAIHVLDDTHERIILIVNEQDNLLGVVTDSNIRKWILKSRDASEPVSNIMTTNPICVYQNERSRALQLMEKYGIDAVPVIDENKVLKDVIFRLENVQPLPCQVEEKLTNPVVIMAGGKGTRLYPYTQVLPKPLIPIGEKTILELIIESFTNVGCIDFYLSVNYKKNLIKAYYADLHPSYSIQYIEEKEFEGTAGSLALLKGKFNESFLVSNCDILLNVNYVDVMKFHKENNNKITLISSLMDYKIPYGVLNLDEDGNVDSITEKPEMNYLINTGVYVLSPDVLNFIPDNQHMDLPELIDKCIENQYKVGVYPVTKNSWEDMGEIIGMTKMVERRERYE